MCHIIIINMYHIQLYNKLHKTNAYCPMRNYLELSHTFIGIVILNEMHYNNNN